jgi:hypothetical protein
MDRELARVQTLARVMDRYLVDPLIGFLLPGIGDVIGSVIGLYIVVVAWRRRVSPVLIARMIMNLGVDMVVGIVPILGDAFDVAFKANQRNADLLVQRTAGRATWRDWVVVGLVATAFFATIGLVIWGVIALVRAL